LSLKTQPVTSISAPLHILVDSNKRPGLASVSAPVRTNEKVVYCSGYTTSGRACRLRQGTASGKSEKWFCHHHIDSVHAFRAFSVTQSEKIEFSEFFPAYLELTSQAALKVQMMQPISLDAPVGRIAVFEVLDPALEKDQVSIQLTCVVGPDNPALPKGTCSAEMIFLGYYPHSPVPAYRQLKDLVCIELADLETNGIYLRDGWPLVTPGGGNRLEPPPVRRKKSDLCADCGRAHYD
ncbi:hypothetical protein B0H14DRAFT_2730389, partial [Mycena olivaceomarginata]